MQLYAAVTWGRMLKVIVRYYLLANMRSNSSNSCFGGFSDSGSYVQKRIIFEPNFFFFFSLSLYLPYYSGP